jgi:hypothetical protein
MAAVTWLYIVVLVLYIGHYSPTERQMAMTISQGDR